MYFAVVATFVQTPVDHAAIIFAAADVDVLRLVDHIDPLISLLGWDGPLSVSCSFPAVARFLDAVELVLGLILRQNVYSRRRYVLIVRARVAVRARLTNVDVVLPSRRHHVARSVQAVLLVCLLADHRYALVRRHLAVVACRLEAVQAAFVGVVVVSVPVAIFVEQLWHPWAGSVILQEFHVHVRVLRAVQVVADGWPNRVATVEIVAGTAVVSGSAVVCVQGLCSADEAATGG